MSIRILVPIGVLALTLCCQFVQAQSPGTPLSSSAASTQLQGKTGSIRSSAIAQVAPYLKVDLTAQETADILGTASELSEVPRANAILSIARAKKLGALGAEAALMLEGTTGNNRSMAIAEIAPYLKIGLTGQETANILGTVDELNETPRANAILSIARAKKLGALGAEAGLMLKGATSNARSMAIAEISLYLKTGLTGQETADILGTASELSEAARANAILSIARAKKLGPLGAEAALMLKGATGNNRSMAIAEISLYLKTGLTGQETANILGTVDELNETPRANAILSIARAKKLGALGAEAALMLKGATGNNRSMAIAEIAPYLKIGLTGQETADILGTASELSEAARANAILSIARAKKLGPLGAEAALMLKGATGNNRSMAIAEIAPYLKIGLTGQETADILGTASELSEAARANAILFIARAGKTMPGLTEGELAPVLAGMTGSNRALALSELRMSASHTASSGVPAIRPTTPQVSPAVQPLPTTAAPPAASGLSQPAPRPNGTSSPASTAAGPSPPASGVSEVLSVEERARLNDAIEKRLRHLLQTPQPPYLFAPITFFDNVNIAITGNTTRRHQYDAYYLASLDYRLLAVKRITNARALLFKSKRAAVEKSIAESDRYARMMAASYNASLDAYNSNLDAAEAKAKAVYELSKAAAICGATPLGPAATKLFETTFIVADFGVDWVEGGLSNAAKEQLREIVFTETLNHLGVKNRCANLLASNGLSFNLPGRLRAVVSSPEFKKSLQGIVAASLASAIRGDPRPLVDLIVIQMNGQEARPLRQLNPADTRSVPSALDFALLSKDVYSVQRSDTVNKTLRKLGGQIWVLHEVYESASLTKAVFGGLRAALYVNAKTNKGKCVVVFAGTELTDITDWVNNARQVMGIVPSEYGDGANFAEKAAARCDQDMVLAGHSLGGGIAQYAYLKTGERYRTFTFNPAGLAVTNLDYQSANLRATNVENFIAQAYDPSSGIQLGRDVASLTGVTLGREILVPVYSWSPTTHFIDVLIEGLGVQRSYCLASRLCS